MTKRRGYITAGQKQFLKALCHGERGVHALIVKGIADGAMDDMSAQEASSLIGTIQAARSPRPALRTSAIRETSEAKEA